MPIKKFISLGLMSLIFLILSFEVFFLKTSLHILNTKSESFKINDDKGFVYYKKIIPKYNKYLKGSIFIFPPTGGETILDRLYAADLAYEGYEVFILNNWTGLEIEGHKYELHNLFYSAAQTALNSVINKASTSNFGILGTSVGALHTAVALTTNPKIKSGFYLVGGLPIPEVIINSNQKEMRDLKLKRYEVYSLKDDVKYHIELSKAFRYEPTAQPENYSVGKKIATVISTNDRLVPTKNQFIAKEFFKSQPTYTCRLNHTNTVIFFGLFKRSVVINFFKNNL